MSLEQVREKYGGWQESCKEQNCRLKTDRSRCIAIKAEKHRSDEKESMCDCIVFADYGKLVVGVCELKGRHVDPTQVQKQLNAGAKFAEQMCTDCLGGLKPSVLPIVLTKSISDETRIMLSVTKVEIYGKDRDIIHEKCHMHISDIIQKYS